jgi:cell division protein ZapA (FtsZ GTPase activity inhibitor)
MEIKQLKINGKTYDLVTRSYVDDAIGDSVESLREDISAELTELATTIDGQFTELEETLDTKLTELGETVDDKLTELKEDLTVVYNTPYDADTNKAATMADIENALLVDEEELV